jgi:hypothetical protein
MVVNPHALKMTPRVIYDIYEFQNALVECYIQFLEERNVTLGHTPDSDVQRWKDYYFLELSNGSIKTLEIASIFEDTPSEDATYFEKWLPDMLEEILKANNISDGRISIDYWW